VEEIMPKKNKSSAPEDKAAEYIDSSLMTQRLRYKDDLSARIDGNHGTYRTRMRIGNRVKVSCTCPSDEWPCKHARALAATWERNPGSFWDLQETLDQLASKSKAELLALIGNMAMAVPALLVELGFEDFEDDQSDEEFDDEFE
jgi:uncharacterized Zn finger protein